jgi:hypothetical protein
MESRWIVADKTAVQARMLQADSPALRVPRHRQSDEPPDNNPSKNGLAQAAASSCRLSLPLFDLSINTRTEIEFINICSCIY